MRPIRLPEPPSSFGVPDIFEAGDYNIIKRAVVIGNGFPGAENQCFGLVRALGLHGNQSLYVNFTLSFFVHSLLVMGSLLGFLIFRIAITNEIPLVNLLGMLPCQFLSILQLLYSTMNITYTYMLK